MNGFSSSRVSAGPIAITSGLAAIDPQSLRPISDDFDEQCDHVFAQLDAILDQHAVSRDNIVKLDCFLSARLHFEQWNTAYATYMRHCSPARTTTVVTLPVDGLLIEVQAVISIGGLG